MPSNPEQYGKLVRGKIASIIKNNGEQPVFRRLENDEEYRKALLNKLREEVDEFIADGGSLGERVDIEEVLRAIDEEFGFTPADIEEARRDKHDERGGFEDRVFLEDVE